MSYIDPERLENVVAFAEAQQQQAEYEAEAQQYLESEYQAAVERHPDIDPENIAEHAENFGWDFDAAANHIRTEWAAQNPPRTIGDAVDRMLEDRRRSR